MKKLGRILFIDTVHPELEKILSENGFECIYEPGVDQVKLISIINQFEGLIVRSKLPINKEIISNANTLKFIGRVGSGMENVDVEFAQSKGIRCLNSPEGNRDAVGEHTLAMLLALMRNICRASMQVKQTIWNREENRGYEIHGKTVGIIGYGNMGSAFAQRLRGFEANVIAYDKYKKGFGNEFVKEVEMDEIFNESDVLSLHVPLTEETNYLVNKDYLSKFKKPIILLNTSRGNVVKTSDLVWALKKDMIRGAGLDVLEYESPTFYSLNSEMLDGDFVYLRHDYRVILTPHIGGWTHESNIKLSRVLAEKILDLFKLG
ncbi:MAG: hypothetical protein KGZ97_02085 [Bacteroidetes bacterium]|nr:hypothetical protein [Bacteroidota bacterium]